MNDTKRRMLAAAIACGVVATPSIATADASESGPIECEYYPPGSSLSMVTALLPDDDPSSFIIARNFSARLQPISEIAPETVWGAVVKSATLKLYYPDREVSRSASSQFDFLAYLLHPNKMQLEIIFYKKPYINRGDGYLAYNSISGDFDEGTLRAAGSLNVLKFEWRIPEGKSINHEGGHNQFSVKVSAPGVPVFVDEPDLTLEYSFNPSQTAAELEMNLLDHVVEYRNALSEEPIKFAGSVVDGSHYSCSRGCFLTTATVGAMGLQDDCWELAQLRKFRDRFARRGKAEAALMKEYYELAPNIVKCIDARADNRAVWCRTWLFGILPSSITASLNMDKVTAWLYVRITRRLQQMAKESVHLSA